MNHKGYLAVLIIDITYPLSSCFSMTARNNFDVNTAIDDPDAVLKDRMRTHMGHIQAFAETLEKEVYDRFGVPGVKTDVELNVIRQELGARFAIVARCVTVEIWAWIQELTVRGNGQSLGKHASDCIKYSEKGENIANMRVICRVVIDRTNENLACLALNSVPSFTFIAVSMAL